MEIWIGDKPGRTINGETHQEVRGHDQRHAGVPVHGVAHPEPPCDLLCLIPVQGELLADVAHRVMPVEHVEQRDFDIREKMMDAAGLDPTQAMRSAQRGNVPYFQPGQVISANTCPAPFLAVAGDQRFVHGILPPRHRETLGLSAHPHKDRPTSTESARGAPGLSGRRLGMID